MAADHWRKRLNGTNVAGCSSWEQPRGKKKKFEPLKNDLNTKSHISLEWDNHQKRVVAKREQIGIHQRDLRSVLLSAKPASPNGIADVVTVPREVFQLENLMEVLSPKVWHSYLSVKERNFLVKFLPTGVDAEEIVDDLLSGENFHFGNPSVNWSSSLCAGNLHPDVILRQEQALKTAKKAHYLEIQNYHNDMIKYLQTMKATCERSRDPEKEIFQKTLRDAERPASSLGYEHRVLESEEKVATSESCSLLAEEKGCSSDNQNSSVKGAKHRERPYEKGSSKGNDIKPSTALHGAKSGKVDKVQKHNIQHTDGAQYMSYLKISKKQHQLVKSMKQSGKSIQSESLSRVLGNLDMLDVQPFEEFVKEEEKKLHEHWHQLAVKDFPAMYVNWRARQSQRQEMIRSLGRDLKLQCEVEVEDEEVEEQDREGEDYDEEELEQEREQEEEYDDENEGANEDDDKEEEEEEERHKQRQPQPSVSSPYWVNDLNGHLVEDEEKEDINEHSSGEEREEESDVEMGNMDKETDDDEVMVNDRNDCEAILLDQNEQNDAFQDQSDEEAGSLESNPEDDEAVLLDHTKQNGVFQDQSDEVRSLGSNPEDVEEARSSGSLQYQPLPPHISSLSAHGVDTVDDVSERNDGGVSKVNNNSVAEDVIGHGVPISSGEDVWSAVSMPVQSYYDPTSNYTHDQDFVSTSSLIHPHQDGEEQHTQLIDLGSHVHEDTRGDLSQRRSDGVPFGTRPEPDRSGLLQSLFKGQETRLPFIREEQKLEALDFQPQSDVLMEGEQFKNVHIHGHLQPSILLGQGQKRQHTEDYIRHNLSQDVYSAVSSGGYIIPRQTHVNLQDWNPSLAVTRPPSRFPPPSLNGDLLLGQNWFHHGEQHQLRGGGWNGYDGSSGSATSNVPSQSIGGTTADQTLYSVLPHCNQLPPSYPLDSMPVSSGQLMIPRNYGMVGGGVGGLPRLGGNITLPQVAGLVHEHDYFSTGRGSDPVGSSMVMPDEATGWMNMGHNRISNNSGNGSNFGFLDPMGRP
ncbi:unnamed protein product [Linum trigynum]